MGRSGKTGSRAQPAMTPATLGKKCHRRGQQEGKRDQQRCFSGRQVTATLGSGCYWREDEAFCPPPLDSPLMPTQATLL